MSVLSVRERIGRITDAFHPFLMHFEYAIMNGKVKGTADAEALLLAIENAQAQLSALIPQSVHVKDRGSAQRSMDIVVAVEAIAQAKGAVLLKRDALHTLVVRHVPKDAREYWAAQSEQACHGMLRQGPDVLSTLASRGVLAWWRDFDHRWRIVNSHRLTAHADIRAYVAGERIPGRTCQFCRLIELPSVQLIRVDGKRKSPLAEVNGVTQLDPTTAYLHPECQSSWERWVAIANRYATPEAAEAADREAGRSSTSTPPPPEPPEPDKQLLVDSESYTSRGEQL